MESIEHFIRKVVAQADANNAAEAAKILELEQQGIIVWTGDCGYEYTWDSENQEQTPGEFRWNMRNARTGEFISKGSGTEEDFDADLERLKAQTGTKEFWYIDGVANDVIEEGGYLDVPETDLPEEIAKGIQEFVFQYEEAVRGWLTESNAV